MNSFRFAVLGDTHYCTFRNRTQECRSNDSERLPDYFRYAFMTDTLRTFADRIRRERVEFLISTGDLIEGGTVDPSPEEREARALFESCSPAFYLAPGTHDIPRKDLAWRRIEHGKNVFLILDYTNWNDTQRSWLLRELERAKDAEHCFVFAHPPLHLFGRHFFYSPEFSPEVAAILKRFPVDVYFCGHTHNQTVSIHSGMLQITGSSVGFPAQKTIPLEELHVLPDEPENHCFWGIAEDSTPAYWTVDVDGEALTLRWHSLKGEAELRVRKRFAPPEIVSVPPFTRECAPLTLADYCRIRCGWINVFTANKGKKGFRLRLNGTDLGAAPESSCYAARRVQLLPPEVLPSIGEENRLEIEFPQSDVFAAGSFSLELLLLDGRTIRSAVAPELFVCGESPDFEYARSRAETVRGGERRTVMLAFLPRNQKDAEGGFPPNARI